MASVYSISLVFLTRFARPHLVCTNTGHPGKTLGAQRKRCLSQRDERGRYPRFFLVLHGGNYGNIHPLHHPSAACSQKKSVFRSSPIPRREKVPQRRGGERAKREGGGGGGAPLAFVLTNTTFYYFFHFGRRSLTKRPREVGIW